jgi:hypothetical protein
MKFLSTIYIAIGILAAGIFAPSFVQAQGTLYVSNLGQTPTGSAVVGSDSWIAQTIHTGNNPGGYALNSIQLLMDAASGSPSGFAVSIYSTSGGNNPPGSSLGSLGGSDPATGGIFTYTASDITLSPSTWYLVVVTAATPVAQSAYDWSAANGQTQGNGFIIDDTYFSSPDGSSWTFHLRQDVFQLGIYATPVPEPSTLALVALGALFLGFRRWRNY